MQTIYLNQDKSLSCVIDDNGRFTVKSNHQNYGNALRLVANITELVSIDKMKSKDIIKLNGVPYAEIDNNKNINYINLLTSFETRLFSQGKNTDSLPFVRLDKRNLPQLQTDLHTHFAGAISAEGLIECGVGRNIMFDKRTLEKARIDLHTLHEVNGKYLLDDIIADDKNRQLLIGAMKIDTSEQETFNKMEEIYATRGPITKNPNLFIPILKTIAKESKANNVKYLELSLSSVISDTKQLQLLDENMPEIEKNTGVKIRFLGALWRHSDKEWNADEVERLKVASTNPYIVGCDVMGHETNSTMEFYNNIKELSKYAIQNDPDFVVRVHAGENPLFKANARQVLLAVKEAHDELNEQLSKQSKEKLPYPQVRLGHGIYGFDEPAPWDENEKTKNTSMTGLCKEIKPIIEFNMSSNLALNNINGIDEIPIKKYLDMGIRVVLGTDGMGLYSTNPSQEMILAHEAGLTAEDFKKINKTERNVIRTANRRFKRLAPQYNLDKIKNGQAEILPQYTDEVVQRNRQELQKMQENLQELIKGSGANTSLEEIEQATMGKTPIMITGSSQKHWPKISEENKARIREALDVLIHCIDPEKAYLITGGTNHGVEKEAHILANKYNTDENGNLVVLGTLTEDAIHTETNSIEKDTITHAMIPEVDGRPAKRWFDLPDAVLNKIEKEDGIVVGMGGGPIVSDIIQKVHNMGVNLEIMSGVEGASGDKCKLFAGDGYEFTDAKELVLKIIKQNPDLVKDGINETTIDKVIDKIKGKDIKIDDIAENVTSQPSKENAAKDNELLKAQSALQQLKKTQKERTERER
ncbi:MAG: hypothetical protein LBQ05_00015 [Christensenellaceae bacterium]|jgi:adenosine deaminase|nr:hypothetical protein [Christensenellaceae bacterium]